MSPCSHELDNTVVVHSEQLSLFQSVERGVRSDSDRVFQTVLSYANREHPGWIKGTTTHGLCTFT
jgi:hypothetical protein